MFEEAPCALQCGIRQYFPPEEWENAAHISLLESGWVGVALNDTTSPGAPCGTVIAQRDGVDITAERSVGVFQINSCNRPASEDWHHLYNVRRNCEVAAELFHAAGDSWSPWYFSAKQLGLI